MSRVLIVPGLAVHGYAEAPTRRLLAQGHDAQLLDAPTWPGVPDGLAQYGRWLARRIEDQGEPVSVLVGLSVGTQAAAIAAAATALVRHLLLVSPTVEPNLRSRSRLATAFLLRSEPGGPPLSEQVPDWARAGVRRILHGFDSAVQVAIEDALTKVSCPVTVVHGERDPLTSHHWAAALAADHACRLLLVPGGSHSWPYDDADRFVALISELAGSRAEVRDQLVTAGDDHD